MPASSTPKGLQSRLDRQQKVWSVANGRRLALAARQGQGLFCKNAAVCMGRVAKVVCSVTRSARWALTRSASTCLAEEAPLL